MMRGIRQSAGGIAVTYAALLIICAVAIIPFLWMISTSLKSDEHISDYPPQWIPHPTVFSNYPKAIHTGGVDFPLWYRNTLIIATLAVLGTTVSSAIAAYGFAKIRFRGRGVFFVLMLATMMVPFPTIMIPQFNIFEWLGTHTDMRWIGTLRPLWFPWWFGSAFNIFLLRQFFLTIPDELSEAARIDGCTEWGIFWRIMLPLSRSALIVVALFTFMFVWRDFLAPRVYLQHPRQYTLTLGLQAFQAQNGSTPWNLLMAASVMVIAPLILLFFLAQKTFIQGIATTGLKG